MQAACLWWPGVVCALLVCLVLTGCPITEAPEERAPASTPPFQGGSEPHRRELRRFLKKNIPHWILQ